MRTLRLLGVGLLTSASVVVGLTPAHAITPKYSPSYDTFEECDYWYQNNPRAADPCEWGNPGPRWRYSYWP